MRVRPVLTSFLLLIAPAASFAAREPNPPAPPIVESAPLEFGDNGKAIAAYARSLHAFGFSGAILAAKGGRVIAAIGVGAANPDAATPNSPITLFEIASATKQFTAAAAVRLAQDNELSLDDPITKTFPGISPTCSAITLRHLLQHTSGIPGSNSSGSGSDIDKVLRPFLRGGPRHKPGTNWEYWNQGYALATEIIARAADTPYTDYCRETLFIPAGMTATCFTGDDKPQINDITVALGLSAHGPPRSALEHPYGNEYGFQYRGMGGVVTNVWDLWRWDRALKNQAENAILNAASLAELFKPGLNDYALGWYVRTDEHGTRTQSHGGSVRGFTCQITRYPDHDGAIFVLANRDDAPVRPIAQNIQSLLLGPPYAPINPPSPAPATLHKDLAGEYKDQKNNRLVIASDGPTLRASIHWSAQPDLVTRAFIGTNEHETVLFEWTSTLTPLTLARTPEGAITSIALGKNTFTRISK